MSMDRRVRMCLAAAAAALVGGCAQYVNVPADPGDVAVHNPNVNPAVQTSIAALKDVLADKPVNGPYQVVLPPGTIPGRYIEVTTALGRDACWSRTPGDSGGLGLPVLEVRSVRVRGASAEVDVARPVDPRRPDGFRELVTLSLDWSIAHAWHVTSRRVWSSRAEPLLQPKPGDAAAAIPPRG